MNALLLHFSINSQVCQQYLYYLAMVRKASTAFHAFKGCMEWLFIVRVEFHEMKLERQAESDDIHAKLRPTHTCSFLPAASQAFWVSVTVYSASFSQDAFPTHSSLRCPLFLGGSAGTSITFSMKLCLITTPCFPLIKISHVFLSAPSCPFPYTT